MQKIINFLNKDFFKFDLKLNTRVIKGKENYSGFLRRFGATIVDLAFFSLLIVLMVKYNLTTSSNAFLIMLIYPFYSALCLKIYGMTLGKYIFGIKLRGENNIKISFFTLIIREYMKPISIIPLGFGIIRMFFDPYKQTYYDKKLKTQIVIWRYDWISNLLIFSLILGLVLEIITSFN